MSKMSFPKKILLVETIGFAAIILFLWLDEILDLPHKLMGAPATPVNTQESLLETGLVLALALVIIIISTSLAFRLQRADTEKVRLFGVISHDLRSPFTNLIGNADLLRKNFAELSEEDRRTLSAGIFEAADKTHDLLDNLLEWAQMQLEKSAPVLRDCDLRELVADCIDQVGLAATRKQIVITNGVPEDTLVSVDETAIRSVLRNLLSNAVKFSKSGDTIEVAAKGRGKVRLSVTDRGVGMNRKDRRNLFRMGTRSRKLGTSGEKGSGLGLLLSYELLRRSGGKLKVRSEEGKGSVFSFTLPRVRHDGPARPAVIRTENPSSDHE